MKRGWLGVIALVALIGLLVLGISQIEHKGYVLIAYEGLFRYESSLWVFLGVLVALWLLLYGLRLSVRVLLTSAGLVNPWSRLHRRRRARRASQKGFVELIEGRWDAALRHLARAAEGEAQPLIYYLGAARAAQRLGKIEHSEELLEKALQRQPEAELAVALTHAELQCARGEAQQALETLQLMAERYPQQPRVLDQLQQLYRQRQDWSALLALLPALRKAKVLDDGAQAELELQAWRGRLGEAGSGEATLEALSQAWRKLTAAQQQRPELLAIYAERLRGAGAEHEAEVLLSGALKRQYHSALVRLYGLLRGEFPGKQLQLAEGWLREHPNDADLLLTLGRLCLHNQLWGKARSYLERSLAQQRDPESCAQLAHLLAQLGEIEGSNQLFQEGLGLLDQRLSGLPVK